MRFALFAVLAALAVPAAAAPAKTLVAVCAPGSPGSTAEAQSALDAFATTAGAKAKEALAAVYDETEDAGVKRMAGAGVAIVSLPFYLKHGAELGLHARLLAVQEHKDATQKWSLVAKKGKVHDAAGLAGFKLVSSAAFAPRFVKGSALGAWGALPASVTFSQTGAVLSSLRKAAQGESIAVLLDAEQAASIASLPFAGDLEVVAQSPALPVGIVATIDARFPEAQWPPLEAALVGLAKDPAGAKAMAGIQMTKFVALDAAALASAQKAYEAAK
ncbi:MAG TPA: hypothetical protein VGM88_23605 [Kofleriaceae bacterium]|jgi:hypothetical protein